MNVGSIPPNEVDAFMQKTISNMKRTPYVDKKTGDYNLKFNMQNMMEDFYIPIRGNDTTTKIDTTKGLDYDGIQDVAYLRDKLFAALKVPKAFLGYDENIEGKATLATQDIRFARTIDRIQRILVSELNKIALVHLYSQGYRDEALKNKLGELESKFNQGFSEMLSVLEGFSKTPVADPIQNPKNNFRIVEPKADKIERFLERVKTLN